MIKKVYSIDIHASREKVWQILWNDSSYRKWTSVFSEGSHAISDWEEGSRISFLAADGGGMYSCIEKKIPNEFMSFRHIGVLKEGVEQPLDEESKQWSGAMENYTLRPSDGGTSLAVDMDITEDFAKYFEEKFPLALEKVKELAEKESSLNSMNKADKQKRLELLHRKMLEEVQDYAIILLDSDGTILTWNKGVEKIKGYKQDEIVGQNFSIFYLPQDRQEKLPDRLLEQACKEGRAKHIGRRVRKDGSIFWGSILITALHDDDGNVVGFTKLTKELRDNEID